MEGGVTEYGLQKAKAVYEEHIKSIKKAYHGGVKIALSMDFCDPNLIPNGKNAKELALLVNKIGMTPLEAIMAATKIGAEALGLEQDLGTLEEGKKADLLIINGNPINKIEVLEDKNKIIMVMKDGLILVDRR